jgi:light-regulated signal transduction histidine kinase (bacteriophytochrome)
VQDVFQKFKLAAQARRQRLVAQIDQGLPAINADLGMIERVLTNLLDNAIRHTPEGGEIRVCLAHDGAGLRVEVSYTGPGIPPDLQPLIFTRPAFASGNERGGGLGLMIERRRPSWRRSLAGFAESQAPSIEATKVRRLRPHFGISGSPRSQPRRHHEESVCGWKPS